MSCLLISAYNLRLPATTLTNGCYQDMFYNCTYLKSAPKILPYISTIQSYDLYMFQNCTSLIKFPDPILNLDNVTIRYNDNVELNNSFTAKLAATQGNNLLISTVVVKMGTQDITSSVYDHGTRTITIPNVTDIITISAKARIYDAEVEYLQSDGIAYIDTGIQINYNSDVIVEQKVRVAYNDTTVRQLNGANGWGFWGCSQDNKFDSAAGTSTTSVGTTWHDVSLLYKKDNNKAHVTFYANGTNVKETSNGTINNSDNYDIFIFAIGGKDSAEPLFFSNEKIKSYQIFNDDILVRDFIPVCKDGVGYLYDNVSGTLFGNANTQGLFTYGKIEFEDPLVKSICVEN